MKSAWSHLPNAALIDRILADVRARPQAWFRQRPSAAQGAAWAAARDAAWEAARDAAMEAARDAAWEATRAVAWKAAWPLAPGAIAALVAWDRASSYLDLPAEQVRILALLGDNIASLMLPAAFALETERELA